MALLSGHVNDDQTSQRLITLPGMSAAAARAHQWFAARFGCSK